RASPRRRRRPRMDSEAAMKGHWLLLPAAFAAFFLATCSDAPTSLPPLGEVEIVVDTDMPVPRLVSRLRLDVYTEPDVRWVQSREFLRANPSDWPTSFVVASPDPDRGGSMRVRLRAYLDGKIRDYRGERYLAGLPEGGDAGAVAPIPAPTNR